MTQRISGMKKGNVPKFHQKSFLMEFWNVSCFLKKQDLGSEIKVSRAREGENLDPISYFFGSAATHKHKILVGHTFNILFITSI
jgi:hypothetical protein